MRGFVVFVALAGCSEATPTGGDRLVTSIASTFGMCAGVCSTDLQFDGDAVLLVLADFFGENPVASQSASLTPDGVARLEAIEADLPDALDAVYGCPDCADGGAMTLTLADGRGTTQWEYFNPPAELADVDGLFQDLVTPLQDCVTTDDIVVDTTCVPYTP